MARVKGMSRNATGACGVQVIRCFCAKMAGVKNFNVRMIREKKRH